MKQPNLEREIVAALQPDGDITSEKLNALLERTEAAIAEADRAAVGAKERAYDPQQSPDLTAARQLLEDSIFAANRLLTLKPRLVQRLQQVAAAEEHARWLGEYEALKSKIAAAAERWSENYADCIADLANLIAENESFAADILRVNLAAPANEPRRLRSPELTARNEPMGTRSILDDLKLVDLDVHRRLAITAAARSFGIRADERRRSALDDRRLVENWRGGAAASRCRRTGVAAAERRRACEGFWPHASGRINSAAL